MKYACGQCGAAGVRLWREWQANGDTLLCQRCTEAHQDRKLAPHSDQIGWFVPAVPNPPANAPMPSKLLQWRMSDADGNAYATFHGYHNVPPAAARWWKDLPSQ